MRCLTVGVVDYGVGNHSSVHHVLRKLGYRCRITAETELLAGCDVLLLPGVGAFPPAMRELRIRGLDQFIVNWARTGRPLIGICLGMQLLAHSSDEGILTKGLGILPGKVSALGEHKWHIGWNTLDKPCEYGSDPLMQTAYEQAFYFNHSYIYQGPQEHITGYSRLGDCRFATTVRQGVVIGVQFHPEKSQANGVQLLCTLINGVTSAK